MAEEVLIIKTVLDLSGSEQKLGQQVEKALSSPQAQTAAKNAGKKLGDALGLGIETTRKTREDKELVHLRRIEAIQTQSNARLIEIERRKQAQLDVLRERNLQKEIEHQRKIERETQRGANALGSLKTAAAGIQTAFTAIAGLGIAALFARVGRSALDAALDIDKQVNTLKALTGSAQAAQKRFEELFALAQKTPGLTTNLALTLDAQLRVFNVSVQTIDKLLPVIGRLNAIAPITDPQQFVNNLTQLISTGFQVKDLRELVRASPIAGNLIKEIFDVDNPTNGEAIRAAAKRMGITTMERFAEEITKAAETNSALRNATESLAGQFEKLGEQANLALAPIGKEIAGFLLPTFKELIPLAKDFGTTLTRYLQDNRGEIAQFRKAVIDLAAAFTSLGKISIPILGDILQTAANGVGFYADLANMFRGDFSFSNSRANFGNLLPGGRTPSAQNRAASAGAPSRFSLLGATPGGGRSGGGGVIGGDASRTRRPKAPPKDLLSAAFVKTRNEFDLGKGQKAIEDHMADLARVEIQRQKDEVEAFTGIVKAIQEGEAKRAREAEKAVNVLERTSRRELTRSGRFIGDAVNRGQLTTGEAESLSRGAAGNFANQLREVLATKEKMTGINDEVLQDLRDEIELYDRLSVSVSNTERFMRGFNSQIETVGDAFDRFGQNVARAFTNVKTLFDSLKQAVLGFFNDLLGNTLQNLVRGTLGGLFGKLGGSLGGLFGGGAGGNIFRTPPFVGNALAAGSSIAVPAALSSFGPIGFGQGLSPVEQVASGGNILHEGAQVFGAGLPSKLSFSALGKSFAAVAPFLGLSLGSGLGGQSIGGQILGGAGGFLTGGVIAGALSPGLFSGAAAALFSNPFTAIAGAGLLVGSLLLGKASQRKKDEEASGEFLRQALTAIDQLASGISSGSIDGSQARAIFDTQILGTFRQQISGLKTKSVRDSRLTNQVRDLEAVYQARIPPLIAEQQRRQAEAEQNALTHSKLIPEFASGGVVPGINRGFDSVRALLTPGEMVLNQRQQSAIRSMAGGNIFQAAGVPTMNQTGRFAGGGVAGAGDGGPVVIDRLVVAIDSEAITVKGLSGSKGRNVIVNQIKVANTNREL